MAEQINQDIKTSLDITKNSYNEFQIKIVKPVNHQEFLKFVDNFCQQEIEQNLSKDAQTETTAIWVYLQPPNLSLLSQLVQRGYEIHGGKGKNISVYKFISKGPCLIPFFSEFYIGCGAVLIKDQCIFLVQEKQGEYQGYFNIPNGRANQNQTIAECVQRQLLEETNIKAKFKYIISLREASPLLFGSADLYFPCFMELSEDSFKELKLCQVEIKSYKWVHLKDYYEFMIQNKCTQTQKRLAQYLTRLWKQGFNFEKMVPNVTKTEIKQKPTYQHKFVMHELIRKLQ